MVSVYLSVCQEKNTGPIKLKFCIKLPDIRRSNMRLQLPYTFRYRFVCIASSSLILRSYLLYPLLRNDILVVRVKMMNTNTVVACLVGWTETELQQVGVQLAAISKTMEIEFTGLIVVEFIAMTQVQSIRYISFYWK